MKILGSVSARYEWLLLAVAAPFLLFPAQFPAAAVGFLYALLALWVAQVGAGALPWRGTPVAWPWVLFCLAVLISVVVSPATGQAIGRLPVLLLGMALMRATVLAVRTPEALRDATRAYVVLVLAAAAVGVLGTDWSGKFPSIHAVASLIPRWVSDLPGTDGGVNSNALAATTLYLLPLLASIVLSGGREGPLSRSFWLSSEGRQLVVCRAVGLAILGMLLVILVLSQSRTAWVSLLGTVGVMSVFRSRRAKRHFYICGVLGATMLLVPLHAQSISHDLDPGETVTGGSIATLEHRLELWSRGITAVTEHPYTGIGFGGFRDVVHGRYPMVLIDPDVDVAHAHNGFLQAALDVGVPGLVAYLSLLIGVLALAWRLHANGGELAHVALGLGFSLLAVQLFSLTDAVALGSRVGVLTWFNMALIVAAFRLNHVRACAESREHGFGALDAHSSQL